MQQQQHLSGVSETSWFSGGEFLLVVRCSWLFEKCFYCRTEIPVHRCGRPLCLNVADPAITGVYQMWRTLLSPVCLNVADLRCPVCISVADPL